MRPEAQFVHELKESVQHLYPNSFWLKIPDMPMGFQDRDKLPDSIRFNPIKPFDIITIIDGIPIAIECKYAKGEKFIWESVSDRQVKNLFKFKEAGGFAFIAIKLGYYDSLMSLIDIDSFITLCRELNLVNVKSINLFDPVNSLVRIKVNKKLVWDIRKPIKEIRQEYEQRFARKTEVTETIFSSNNKEQTSNSH